MKSRPLDVNLNMGVGDREGALTYYIFNKPFSELNTFSPEHRDDSLRRYSGIKLVKEQEIEVFTLPEILKKYNNGIYPDYMSIDVEGLETGILATCDFTPENSPIAITVEGATPELHREHTAILANKGYVPYARTGVNITYVRK
jgi:FkbM family methyltransferase